MKAKKYLKGGQIKLDANKDGKITGEDFKMLKGKMMMGGGKMPMYKDGGKWIQEALAGKKEGALHKQMGVPMGEKIPMGKLEAAAKKGGKLGKRAQLAMTLRNLKK